MTMKEILGTFTITDGALRQQTVIVSQEAILDENRTIVETHKHFNLNSLEGEEIQRTEDSAMLTLHDGTVLRKISNVQIGNPKVPTQRTRHRRG
jgi:hypothetical protein